MHRWGAVVTQEELVREVLNFVLDDRDLAQASTACKLWHDQATLLLARRRHPASFDFLDKISHEAGSASIPSAQHLALFTRGISTPGKWNAMEEARLAAEYKEGCLEIISGYWRDEDDHAEWSCSIPIRPDGWGCVDFFSHRYRIDGLDAGVSVKKWASDFQPLAFVPNEEGHMLDDFGEYLTLRHARPVEVQPQTWLWSFSYESEWNVDWDYASPLARGDPPDLLVFLETTYADGSVTPTMGENEVMGLATEKIQGWIALQRWGRGRQLAMTPLELLKTVEMYSVETYYSNLTNGLFGGTRETAIADAARRKRYAGAALLIDVCTDSGREVVAHCSVALWDIEAVMALVGPNPAGVALLESRPRGLEALDKKTSLYANISVAFFKDEPMRWVTLYYTGRICPLTYSHFTQDATAPIFVLIPQKMESGEVRVKLMMRSRICREAIFLDVLDFYHFLDLILCGMYRQ